MYPQLYPKPGDQFRLQNCGWNSDRIVEFIEDSTFFYIDNNNSCIIFKSDQTTKYLIPINQFIIKEL